MQVEIPEYKIREGIKLKKDKTALLIVDMQNDFVKKGGRLVVSNAEGTVSPIKRLLDRARENKVKVFFTQDWHDPEDYEFEIWGKHAEKDTWGAEIIEELKPLENEHRIKKLRYDAFFGTPLDHLLRLFKIKNLVVTGTVANICVLHTVGTASLLGYKIIIPKDGVSAITEFDMHVLFRQVDFLYNGIIVEKGEDIEFV